MTTEQIQEKRNELEKTLRYALTIHERSDTIRAARAELIALRNNCPHKENESICPYCGQKLV